MHMKNVRALLSHCLVLAVILCSGCGKDAVQPSTKAGIKGKVVDVTTGQAVEGAFITTTPITQSVMTDASGHYAIETDISGILLVTASKEGYNNKSISVNAVAGSSTSADIGLSPGSTSSNHEPTIPADPWPMDKSLQQYREVVLNWSCTDPDQDPLRYDVYFGTTNPPTRSVATNSPLASLPVSALDSATTYYWMVIAKDNHGGMSSSPIWQFTTDVIHETAYNALRFAGGDTSLTTNQWLSVPHSSQLMLQQGSFTIEAWIKVDKFNKWSSILSRGSSNTVTDYMFMLDGIRPLLQTRNYTNRLMAKTGLVVGRWYHIAGVQDVAAGKLRIYIDGVENNVANLEVDNVIAFEDPIYIGARNYYTTGQPAHTFNGIIHELRVWNVARTPEQIRGDKDRRLIGNEIGLVAYWPLNEGYGTVAKDRSSNGHDAVFMNPPTWVTEKLPVQ